MSNQSQCPHRICRSGLWFIVRPQCHGQRHIDAINGDGKVWCTDCLACEGSAEPDILEEILDARVLQELL